MWTYWCGRTGVALWLLSSLKSKSLLPKFAVPTLNVLPASSALVGAVYKNMCQTSNYKTNEVKTSNSAHSVKEGFLGIFLWSCLYKLNITSRFQYHLNIILCITHSWCVMYRFEPQTMKLNLKKNSNTLLFCAIQRYSKFLFPWYVKISKGIQWKAMNQWRGDIFWFLHGE